MNPFASVQEKEGDSIDSILSTGNYSALVYGFSSFKEAINLNQLTRAHNIPFYLVNSSGLFGFFYIDLGKELAFSYRKKGQDEDEIDKVTDSKTLKEYLSIFEEGST